MDIVKATLGVIQGAVMTHLRKTRNIWSRTRIVKATSDVMREILKTLRINQSLNEKRVEISESAMKGLCARIEIMVAKSRIEIKETDLIKIVPGLSVQRTRKCNKAHPYVTERNQAIIDDSEIEDKTVDEKETRILEPQIIGDRKEIQTVEEMTEIWITVVAMTEIQDGQTGIAIVTACQPKQETETMTLDVSAMGTRDVLRP
jgi:hypothetical protein